MSNTTQKQINTAVEEVKEYLQMRRGIPCDLTLHRLLFALSDKQAVDGNREVVAEAMRVFMLYQTGSDVGIGMKSLGKALRKAGLWKPKKRTTRAAAKLE